MASLPPPSFVIETENFMLRPMLRGDACAAMEPWIEDETAAEMLNAKQRRWSIAEQAELFSRYEGQRTQFLLGLFPKGQTEPIGLFIIKLRPEDDVMQVTHLVGAKERRGQGASREASIGIFDYFFNQLGYEKARANVQPANRSMAWLLLNGGWRREAELTKHLLLKASGERADLHVFGIMADEWRANRDSANTVRKGPAR
jgi:RimJ/RimL family protein N-acetyltransferase